MLHYGVVSLVFSSALQSYWVSFILERIPTLLVFSFFLIFNILNCTNQEKIKKKKQQLNKYRKAKDLFSLSQTF